jgi:nickel-dependent lactate racemase
MRVSLEFGQERLTVEVTDQRYVPVRRAEPAPVLGDVSAAVQHMLESPVGFPPLRQALTPDDQAVIVADEALSQLPRLIAPVLECLVETGLDLTRTTLLCPPRHGATTPATAWLEDLPLAFRSVKVEVHDPADRSKLSYLATTRGGRRIYLNRTLVDADQLVVLGRVRYDPVLGYAGGLGDLFPSMSDEATRAEFATRTTEAIPDAKIWPARKETQEVGWLLGMPFLLQVVEGHGDTLSHVFGGAAEEVSVASRRGHDRHWRVSVPRRADLVVAGISGDPQRQGFAEVASALACAARIVQPGGRIVVLSRVGSGLGPAEKYLRQADSPARGLALVRQHKLPDAASAWQLAVAAEHAQLYLLSALAAETVEELFMVPLEHPSQVQRLLDSAESCAYLPDAQRTLAVIEEHSWKA